MTKDWDELMDKVRESGEFCRTIQVAQAGAKDAYIDANGRIWMREAGDATAEDTYKKWQRRSPEEVSAMAAALMAEAPGVREQPAAREDVTSLVFDLAVEDLEPRLVPTLYAALDIWSDTTRNDILKHPNEYRWWAPSFTADELAERMGRPVDEVRADLEPLVRCTLIESQDRPQAGVQAYGLQNITAAWLRDRRRDATCSGEIR